MTRPQVGFLVVAFALACSVALVTAPTNPDWPGWKRLGEDQALAVRPPLAPTSGPLDRVEDMVRKILAWLDRVLQWFADRVVEVENRAQELVDRLAWRVEKVLIGAGLIYVGFHLLLAWVGRKS